MDATDPNLRALVRKLAAQVMQHEGGYDAVNRNTDSAGVSLGIFQWPQRTGGLGQLLRGYYRADPQLFVRVFGPQWKALLEAAASRSMAPVGGALLWEEPWVSRFQVAGRQPVFQAVQDRLAVEGVFMRAAFASADILGFTTERALAMALDTAVAQGPEFAQQVAARVRRLFAGKTVPVRDVLSTYLQHAVAHFRSDTQPQPRPGSSLTWRKVGPEWHAFAGSIDLYANIMKRRRRLVEAVSLSDTPIGPSDTGQA